MVDTKKLLKIVEVRFCEIQKQRGVECMVQNTDLTFFTNEPERDLYSRFSKILKSNTQFLMCLLAILEQAVFSRCMMQWRQLRKLGFL